MAFTRTTGSNLRDDEHVARLDARDFHLGARRDALLIGRESLQFVRRAIGRDYNLARFRLLRRDGEINVSILADDVAQPERVFAVQLLPEIEHVGDDGHEAETDYRCDDT